MLHLFLDESGDLGFDFVNKKPSKFFTITILVLSSTDANRKLIKAIKKTLSRKLNLKNKNKVHELKGSSTTMEIKKYGSVASTTQTQIPPFQLSKQHLKSH